MRVAVDSNILIYAEGLNDSRRQDIANELLNAIGAENIVLPLQAAGETFLALLRSAEHTRESASARIARWTSGYAVQETTSEVFARAIDLVRRHGLQVWDSIILSAASVAGAAFLLSEDMQDGFRFRQTIVLNPFTGDAAAIMRRLSRQKLH
jgi:predicted nucleic acid-binding protein